MFTSKQTTEDKAMKESQYEAVLAQTGEDLSTEQYAKIEEMLLAGKSVKDTVKAVRKM